MTGNSHATISGFELNGYFISIVKIND